MARAKILDAQCPVFQDRNCDICENKNTAFKCLHCDEILCDSCKNIHLKSKMAKNHKVVRLENAETYQRNETETKCPTHTTEDLQRYCISCQVPICWDCMTSGSHHNHEMIKIETFIEKNQNELSKLIRQSKEYSSKYEDAVKIIDKNSSEFSLSVSQKINEVKARNNQLKAALDRIESEYIKHLQKSDRENQKAMKELKSRLHEEMTYLNQLIQQSEGKHGNKNIGMGQSVTELKRRMEKYRSFVPPDVACPPDLITRHVDDQELKNLFGQLGIKSTVNPPLPSRRKLRSGRLVMDAKIVSRFTSDQTSVVTTGNDQAWIWNFNDRHMSLVTSDGEVIQCINTEFDVCDAAVSTSGDLLVTVCNGNKVKMLTKHKTFTDVYTAADDCLTGGITTSDTGNVLVTLNKVKDSKVVEISTSGKLVRTIQYDTADNKSLFDRPWFICSNINGDIIVSDDRNKVVAVSKSGTKRFIYDGKERKLQNSFNPRYVVTDKYGNILIADYYNSAVHVLDQDGKFIKYLIKGEHGCDKPFGMDINSSDRLWLYNNGPSEVFVTKLSYNRM